MNRDVDAQSHWSKTSGRLGREALFGHAQTLVRRVDRLLALKGRVRPNVSVLAAVAVACALVAIALTLRTIPLVAEAGDVMFPRVSVRLKPDTTYALSAPVAPIADAPVLIARIFNGDYRSAAAVAPAEAARPWHIAESAGIKIAHTFTRAGVSLARRF